MFHAKHFKNANALVLDIGLSDITWFKMMMSNVGESSVIRTLVEILFSCALFVNAVLYIPQAVKLYKTKKSHGLSLFMFAGFSVIQLLTILHAYFESDWILLVGYILAFLTCGAITLQLVLYRKGYPVWKQWK